MRSRGSRGSILLEVMVATLLVTLLVVPLAEGLRSAVERARTGRESATEQAAASWNGDAVRLGDADPWSWGAQVVEGWWRPGPVLHLRVAALTTEDGPQSLFLGAWVDGWCIQEESISPHDPVNIDQTAWYQTSGRELVIRLRTDGGVWGPPWRTQVPDADGEMPAGPSLAAEDPGARTGPEESAALIVHVAHLGTSIPVVTEGSEVATPLMESAPFLYPAGNGGWWRAETEGRSQWWWMGPGRALDVYF